jgi:hypothetical protein
MAVYYSEVNRPKERRRYGRIRLAEPLPGHFGASRVRVFELSVTGFMVAHEARYAPGEVDHLVVDWEGLQLDLICRLVRSTIWRLAKSLGEKSIYHSGLQIIDTIGDAYEKLRQLIAERIIRAIEEQKANARGIPPLAAYMYQPGKGDLYRRCEFINGEWRRTETVHAEQPASGFTVSAETEPEHIELLCKTWEMTTPEGRRLTQMLASLSISKNEGIPTRRYEP